MENLGGLNWDECVGMGEVDTDGGGGGLGEKNGSSREGEVARGKFGPSSAQLVHLVSELQEGRGEGRG